MLCKKVLHHAQSITLASDIEQIRFLLRRRSAKYGQSNVAEVVQVATKMLTISGDSLVMPKMESGSWDNGSGQPTSVSEEH